MGTIEVICGPMFSGKTEELIRRVTRAVIPTDDRVVVGAAEAYEPRCRKCFSPEPRPASTPPEQELFPFLQRGGPRQT